LKHWKEFYENKETFADDRLPMAEPIDPSATREQRPTLISENAELSQLLNTYIVLPATNAFLLIHQQSAHERIIYERLKNAALGQPIATQRSMFPVTLELVPADAAILEEIMTDLGQLGYLIEPFGRNTYVVQGTPADVEQGNEKGVIDILLEQYKHFSNDMKFSKREKLVRALARQQAIKTGLRLTEREMRGLVNDLFACEQPNVTPDGGPVYLEFKQEQLDKMFWEIRFHAKGFHAKTQRRKRVSPRRWRATTQSDSLINLRCTYATRCVVVTRCVVA